MKVSSYLQRDGVAAISTAAKPHDTCPINFWQKFFFTPVANIKDQ